jgi:hypothetical protein
MKRFFRHPKDIFRHPKKAVTAVVHAIENQVLEPVAKAVENEVVEPVANGVNDHVIKPFCRGFKHKIEKHAEHDGETAADVVHEALVKALTDGDEQEADEYAKTSFSDQEDDGEKPAKRARH